MSTADDLPVIVGVGHATRHPTDTGTTTETVDLLAESVLAAADDAGIGATGLGAVDSLDVLNLLSWKYADPTGAVAGRTGMSPDRQHYSKIGGEQPTALIDAAADRIARGETGLAVVVGGECLASRRVWARAGEEPPWSERGEPPHPVDPYYGVRRGLGEAGLGDPTQVYPLFEHAHRAATGVPAEQSEASSARIWAAMSEVAARTPGAWTSEPVPAAAIATGVGGNRMVAHPYRKLLCANPNVDQAGAVIVTSAGRARRLGIPADRWVYPWAGAGAEDSEEVIERPSYATSEPLRRSILDALALAGLAPGDEMARELYSCFPIVPKLALEALGLPDTAEATVAGGLTFYGGPLNAYMACATVAMVRRLRGGGPPTGMLYGNGGYATKHHTLIVSTGEPPEGRFVADRRDERQAELDRRPRPELARRPEGTATVETWSVVYGRDEEPARGVVVARLDGGTGPRFAARITDRDTLGWMVAGGEEPIGRSGRVEPGEGPPAFAFT
jgi:acetyl-CoA C-acetyltransferase